MTLDELKRQLDAVGWQEQLEAEVSERPSVQAPPDLSPVEQTLRELASRLGDEQLDALEHEPGYLIWCLRLASHGDPASARKRARRHLNDAHWRTRHWVQRLLAAGAPDEPAAGH